MACSRAALESLGAQVLAARLGMGGALGVRVPGVDGRLGVGGALGVRGYRVLPLDPGVLDLTATSAAAFAAAGVVGVPLAGSTRRGLPALGVLGGRLGVAAVDLHSLHLLYSLMKDKLSHHEYVAVPFGRW